MAERDAYSWLERSGDGILVALPLGALAGVALAYWPTSSGRTVRLFVLFAALAVAIGVGTAAGLRIGRPYVGGCWLQPAMRKACLVLDALAVVGAVVFVLAAGGPR